MLLALLPLVVSYIELTSENIDSMIGGANHVFVKFYSPDCPYCNQMAEDFEEASLAYPDTVSFAGVDCNSQAAICKQHEVLGRPFLKLFFANSTNSVAMHTPIIDAQTLCDFVDNETGIKGVRPGRAFYQLTPANFGTFVSRTPCLLVTFYTTWCPGSKKFLPQLKNVGQSLLGEPNVSVGGIDCGTHKEMCDQHRILGFPRAKLFKDGVSEDYKGKRTDQDVLDFLNAECNINRELGGLLGPTAGLVSEAQELVAEFLSADDKAAVIEKTKLVAGAEFYVKVMERFVAAGEEQIRGDMEKMMEMMKERKGSWNSIDGMRERYNVFAQFVRKATNEDL
jgi:thioredoxin-like negative regulator of GroEL